MCIRIYIYIHIESGGGSGCSTPARTAFAPGEELCATCGQALAIRTKYTVGIGSPYNYKVLLTKYTV